MNHSERQKYLLALRKDLVEDLEAFQKVNQSVVRAYQKLVDKETKLKNQIQRIDDALHYFQSGYDPDSPQPDEPIPF